MRETYTHTYTNKISHKKLLLEGLERLPERSGFARSWGKEGGGVLYGGGRRRGQSREGLSSYLSFPVPGELAWYLDTRVNT